MSASAVNCHTASEQSIEQVLAVSFGLMTRLRHVEMGDHTERTGHYMRELAIAAAGCRSYRESLPIERIHSISLAATLHDIGKVGIPSAIFDKREPLTDAEFEIMKKHTLYGREAILRAKRLLGALDEAFIADAADIACSHHERWDGKGYPEGLAEGRIPVVARLMSIADVYDALVTRRSYKAPMTHEESVNVILNGQGTHFDPVLVEVFRGIQDTFACIHDRFI